MTFREADRTLGEIYAKAYDLSTDKDDWMEKAFFISEQVWKMDHTDVGNIQKQNRAIWAGFIERYPRKPNPDC